MEVALFDTVPEYAVAVFLVLLLAAPSPLVRQLVDRAVYLVLMYPAVVVWIMRLARRPCNSSS